ncbi:MAG: twin-arginine translocase subunit TatA [Chloroflexota bacterium]|nr:MAG: twin-arginine translocase subunit TatA [Chloroflexota bacterium]
MGSFGLWEWVIILVIVLLIFGTSRLTDIGKGLGGAINEFKNALEEGKDKSDNAEDEEQQDA